MCELCSDLTTSIAFRSLNVPWRELGNYRVHSRISLSIIRRLTFPSITSQCEINDRAVICKIQGDDSVVECTNEDGQIGLHMSWNTGKRNMRHATVSILSTVLRYFPTARRIFVLINLPLSRRGVCLIKSQLLHS